MEIVYWLLYLVNQSKSTSLVISEFFCECSFVALACCFSPSVLLCLDYRDLYAVPSVWYVVAHFVFTCESHICYILDCGLQKGIIIMSV